MIAITYAEGTPGVRTRPFGATESTITPLITSSWSYTATDMKVCVGHTEFAPDGSHRHVDCDGSPTDGRTCQRCATVTNVMAASMHQAHKLGRAYVDTRLAAHLDKPNRLYVAAFADGSLKVGTTAGSSGGSRLAEQGAWVARYVALAPDGYVVRDLEDAVTEQLGTAQAVSVHRKLAGLVSPVKTTELEKRLDSLVADIHQLIAADPDWTSSVDLLSTPWTHHAATDGSWAGSLAYPNRLDSGAHQFAVIDMCGRIALIETGSNGDRMVTDLGRLAGVVIETGDVDPDPIEVQASLF